MPSSAMLMTPERSENIPPSAASTSGVDNRIVENTSETVKRSAMARPLLQSVPQAGQRPAEHRFRGDEQDDRRLQNLHDVLGDVPGEGVDRDTAAREHGKQQRRKHDAGRMIPAQQRDRDPGESVVV